MLPLVAEIYRVNFQVVIQGIDPLKAIKFTARRREAISDLLRGKAEDLLVDSLGLSKVEVQRMEGVVEELSTEESKGADRAAARMILNSCGVSWKVSRGWRVCRSI